MQKATRPIIILEDDLDDQEIMREVLNDLQVGYRIDFYTNAKEVLEYLYTTKEQPFLIISDVNLPTMNGLELRKILNENEYLRLKSIPFVFFSTSSDEFAVKQAYNLTVQGYFVKQNSIPDIKGTIKLIIEYWEKCEHINSW
ncbi:MAG: response regulator [Chitinophagaceae bacterium]|nr:response regulator [Chitinophagaceae bacterium]